MRDKLLLKFVGVLMCFALTMAFSGCEQSSTENNSVLPGFTGDISQIFPEDSGKITVINPYASGGLITLPMVSGGVIYNPGDWNDGELTILPNPSGDDSIVVTRELFGMYVYENEGFDGDFTVSLYTDGSFMYYVGMLSSYIGIGNWTQDGNIITMTDTTGADIVNKFEIEDDNLIFVASGSDGFMHMDVKDGDKFYKVITTTDKEG